MSQTIQNLHHTIIPRTEIAQSPYGGLTSEQILTLAQEYSRQYTYTTFHDINYELYDIFKHMKKGYKLEHAPPHNGFCSLTYVEDHPDFDPYHFAFSLLPPDQSIRYHDLSSLIDRILTSVDNKHLMLRFIITSFFIMTGQFIFDPISCVAKLNTKRPVTLDIEGNEIERGYDTHIPTDYRNFHPYPKMHKLAQIFAVEYLSCMNPNEYNDTGIYEPPNVSQIHLAISEYLKLSMGLNYLPVLGVCTFKQDEGQLADTYFSTLFPCLSLKHLMFGGMDPIQESDFRKHRFLLHVLFRRFILSNFVSSGIIGQEQMTRLFLNPTERYGYVNCEHQYVPLTNMRLMARMVGV